MQAAWEDFAFGSFHDEIFGRPAGAPVPVPQLGELWRAFCGQLAYCRAARRARAPQFAALASIEDGFAPICAACSRDIYRVTWLTAES
jgi:hypothetical protein